MSRERSLLFLVEVKGHLRSPEVKLRKPHKRLVNTVSQDGSDRHFSYLVYRFIMLRGRTLLFLVEVKGHLRSPEVKKQNFPRIPNIVIWGHQRSKSKISQELPRLSYGVTEVKKQNFPKIPKIIIWGHQQSKSKISQQFPRLSWGHQT
ncbi:hypothetical protein HOLleu_07304 [Holothuria leucospilota]|uniref:Uncharacterized protein n=1 Tax=Holothuria leucospilota TaxID=206669 RepID=A0A9Q1CFY3_HOLLE|nr:hypothetical protein HOLleu_07304 [Holothuria leucospilota]